MNISPIFALDNPLSTVSAHSIDDITALSGRAILDQVSERHDQAYEFEVQDMILVDRAGNKEQREMHRYKRELDAGNSRSVSVFLAPSGIKGVSLLTWKHADSADDQWMYLPAYGRKMKRIAKGGRKNYFMGTDYTFEDLATEERDKFSYQRLADEQRDKVPLFVIKALPIDATLQKESGYAFRKLWVTQDTFMVMQVDFFDRRERLIKRQLNSEAVQINDILWRHNRTEMNHFQHKHQTITVIRSRRFDSDSVPEKAFKERAIINGLLTR